MFESFSTQLFLPGIMVFLFVILFNSNASAQKDDTILLQATQDHSAWSSEEDTDDKKRRRTKGQSLISLDFSGGLLFDVDEYYESRSMELREKISKNNYVGSNYLLFGLNNENEDRIIGLALEVFYFKIEPTPRTMTSPIGNIFTYPDFNREKIQTQLIFHYGKSLINTSKYRFNWGPIASFLYNHQKHAPITINSFYVSDTKFGIGLGLKIQNQFQLTDKLGLTLGTRYFILDSVMDFERTANPALPLRTQRQGGFRMQLLRKEFLLQLGLNFKL